MTLYVCFYFLNRKYYKNVGKLIALFSTLIIFYCFTGGSSHKSSPQVSVDSSHSSGVISPLSKSPGLQKHTRSSSHESYFESNSMDIISEPSFEDDEHGLFYYVSEQMRMLQGSSSLPWHSDNTKSIPTAEVENKMEGIDDGSVIETEKNVRKQKSTAVEDAAQAKVQKLNETHSESMKDSPSVSFQTVDSSNNTISPVNCCHNDNDCLSKFRDPEKPSVWQLQSENNNQFTSEDVEITIDPMLLYDAILNKRSSIISSSDTDNEANHRTIVERYGNAETVLVEVHATQDSSSEEDQYTGVVEDSKEEIEHHLPIEDDGKTDVFDNLLHENIENTLVESDDSVESPSLKSHSPISFDDISLDIAKEETLPPESIETSSIFIEGISNEFNISDSCDDKASVAVENFKFESPSISPMKQDIAISDVFTDIKPQRDVSLLFSDELKNNKDISLKFEKIKEVSPSNKPQELDTSRSFSINSPPPPIYPSKSLKLQDFQSLKTKIETVPVHKKKHIIIPSPSSPVEEVRKKFELHASNSKKVESPTSEVKPRFNVKELTAKHRKAFEDTETTLPVIEDTKKQKQDIVTSSKTETVSFNKRYSEPPPKSETTSLPESCKRMSHKYENEISQVPKVIEKVSKPKAQQQPSLFTQLKIRKLQSLQAEVAGPPPEPIDPWSDPILDMQEDYHPIIYSPSHLNAPFNDSDSDLQEETKDTERDNLLTENINEDYSCKQESSDNISAVNETKMEVSEIPVSETKSAASDVTYPDVQQIASKPADIAPESEAVKRERINRIKEERRAQLREKLKSESFRYEAEEKEKVQTKFRLRKDCCRSTEDNSKDVKKSDKAVETDSADITETGTNCDLSAISDESNSKAQSSDKFSTDSDLSNKHEKDVIKISDDYVNQTKSKKPSRSYDDSRKWLSMPPTDIRDKVAMFERSKETKELCRLGPNGKFIQKQSPSALTSSFVR